MMIKTEIQKTKFSQFNSVVPFGDKFVVYNSFEDRAIFIENELKELLEEVESIDKLQDIHPAFFDYLKKENFILEAQVDELQKVKDVVSKVDNNPKTFLLTVNPTMNCNFKCWYCYETRVKQSRLEAPVVESINKFITQTIGKEDIKHFNLSFFGGEPLLYFSITVVPIIDHLINEGKKFDKSFHVSFTTNGYLINDDLIKYFLDKNIKVSFQITFDGYAEQHDSVRFVSKTRGSYRDIVTNIKKLLKYDNFNVIARINYTSENIQNCHKTIDDFEDIPGKIRESRIVFDFQRVWQDRNLGDDTENVVEENTYKIDKKGFITSTFCSHNGVKDSCYADKRNSAVINYNGDVYKCTARDFSSENREGYIDSEGCLVWENDSLEHRMQAKFKNRPCLMCKILPLCNGGCSQSALERSDKEYCIYGDSMESQIQKIVQARVEKIYKTAAKV